jgi:hypothetical protein
MESAERHQMLRRNMMQPSSARHQRESRQAVDFQWTTWHFIPEDGTLHNHCCENLESYMRNFNLVLSHVLLTIDGVRIG